MARRPLSTASGWAGRHAPIGAFVALFFAKSLFSVRSYGLGWPVTGAHANAHSGGRSGHGLTERESFGLPGDLGELRPLNALDAEVR